MRSAAADPALDLIQLRQTEGIGVVNQDRIGVGNIDAVSMIVVQISTLTSLSVKRIITSSISSRLILPWATAISASGTSCLI